MTDYISKWRNEYIARNNTEIINVGDRVLIAKPYRQPQNIRMRYFESLYENEIYRVIHIEDNLYSVREEESGAQRRVQRYNLKKIIE